jgi:hypothetical protein
MTVFYSFDFMIPFLPESHFEVRAPLKSWTGLKIEAPGFSEAHRQVILSSLTRVIVQRNGGLGMLSATRKTRRSAGWLVRKRAATGSGLWKLLLGGQRGNAASDGSVISVSTLSMDRGRRPRIG